VNAAFENLFGVSRQDVVGQAARPRSGPVPVESPRDRRRGSAEHTSLRYETSIQVANGNTIRCDHRKTPLMAEDGTITGIASVITGHLRTETPRRSSREGARAAEAAVHAKSASSQHEP